MSDPHRVPSPREPHTVDHDNLVFPVGTPLPDVFVEVVGAGCRVGSSCTIIRVQYPGGQPVSIMLDYGLGPKEDRPDEPPNLMKHFNVQSHNEVVERLNQYNMMGVVITHHHFDHCAGLPLLIHDMAWKRPVYGSFPTLQALKRSIPGCARDDRSPVMNHIPVPFNFGSLLTPLSKGERVPLGWVVDPNNPNHRMRIDMYLIYAGHVLGATQVVVEVGYPAATRVIYSGDITVEGSENLAGIAYLPPIVSGPTILISEGTYASHSRKVSSIASHELLDTILKTVIAGKKLLIPLSSSGSLAIGLVKFIEESLRMHGLDTIPILVGHVDRLEMTNKSYDLQQHHWGAVMNSSRKERTNQLVDGEWGLEQWRENNDFTAKQEGDLPDILRDKYCSEYHSECPNRETSNIKNLDSLVEGFTFERLHQCTGAIILAGPSSLNHGLSRQVVAAIANDEKNVLFLPSHCAPHSFAHRLMINVKKTERVIEVADTKGGPTKTVPMKCRIMQGSWAAHPDLGGLKQYFSGVNPTSIVLVHGEKFGLVALQEHLKDLNASFDVRVPDDCTIMKFNCGRVESPENFGIGQFLRRYNDLFVDTDGDDDFLSSLTLK